MDHVSRAVKEGAYNPDLKDVIFGIVPSKQPYSANGLDFGPFILEPPWFPNASVLKDFTGLFKFNYTQKVELGHTIQSYINSKI